MGVVQRGIKRGIDVVVAGAALLVLSPLIGVIALLVRMRLGRPVLFRQPRAGLHGDEFRIVKFRTMTDACDADGRLLPDADRLTALGSRLRSLSLDELPELWNVVRGEMSLVGPRPLPMRYLERYTPVHARRHDVRPGVTGWAQVNGRNLTTWWDRLDMDVWYVEHQSLALDLRILAKTVLVVLTGHGVSAEGHVTMEDLPPLEVQLARARAEGRTAADQLVADPSAGRARK